MHKRVDQMQLGNRKVARMDKETLKRAWTLIMLALLVSTASEWMHPGAARVSGYEAPWIHPELRP